MKTALSALAFSLVALVASGAAAQVAGAWQVTGKIADNPFALDCRFEPHGAQFGGVCVEAASGDKVKPGKAHTLSKGEVAGGQVRWAYPANFGLLKFEVSFDGALRGDRITGVTSASGRKGEFTAVRK